MKQGKSVEVRQAAGLLLKNNLRATFNSLPPSSQQYIKSELLPCLGATDRTIRTTVGTVISVLFQLGRVVAWPELLQALVRCLDSNDLNHMEGAMDAIYKVSFSLVFLCALIAARFIIQESYHQQLCCLCIILLAFFFPLANSYCSHKKL